MTEAAQTGNVVERMTIGNTRVRICDDYCRSRTEDEIRVILARIARRTAEVLAVASPHETEKT